MRTADEKEHIWNEVQNIDEAICFVEIKRKELRKAADITDADIDTLREYMRRLSKPDFFEYLAMVDYNKNEAGAS